MKRQAYSAHEGSFSSAMFVMFYLQSGNHLLSQLLDGHQIAGHFGVNDSVLLLPADYDRLLAMGRAAHFLLLTLSGQGGVWIGRNHRRN